jgi:hypothetical protein
VRKWDADVVEAVVAEDELVRKSVFFPKKRDDFSQCVMSMFFTKRCDLESLLRLML